MNRIVIVFAIIGVMIFGFIIKLMQLKKLNDSEQFTVAYRNKFINYVNKSIKNIFDQDLYFELTMDVNAMQYELGQDGVLYGVIDNLKGYQARNYQLLINILPELRTLHIDRSNIVLMNRHNENIQSLDDMFVRHIGTINEYRKQLKKTLYNPFSCFFDGTKTILIFPILLLKWSGLISESTTYTIQKNIFVKVISFIIAIIGLISSIIGIVLGWSEFVKIITGLFQG